MRRAIFMSLSSMRFLRRIEETRGKAAAALFLPLKTKLRIRLDGLRFRSETKYTKLRRRVRRLASRWWAFEVGRVGVNKGREAGHGPAGRVEPLPRQTNSLALLPLPGVGTSHWGLGKEEKSEHAGARARRRRTLRREAM